MTELSTETLAELERLHAAATPGPWGDASNGYGYGTISTATKRRS